jgi:hypothetical protein
VTPEDAVASLGDPLRANRQYRRVLLTQEELLLATENTGPKFRYRKALLELAAAAALISCGTAFGFLSVAVTVLLLLHTVHAMLLHLFPAAAELRSRTYIIVRALGIVAVGLLLAFFSVPLTTGFFAMSAASLYSVYKHWVALGKLNAKHSPLLVAGNAPQGPELTPAEARFLHNLGKKPKYRIAILVCWMIPLGVAATMIFTAGAGPHPLLTRHLGIDIALTIAAIVAWCLPMSISFQTPESGHRYRRFKWALIAIAAVAPPVSVLILGREFWEAPQITVSYALFSVCYFFLAVVATAEHLRTSLRRKLPLAEWPKELYP